VARDGSANRASAASRLSGDAINHPAQLREPGLATGPDDDVEVALRARRH
jgi:hypothetical protein